VLFVPLQALWTVLTISPSHRNCPPNTYSEPF